MKNFVPQAIIKKPIKYFSKTFGIWLITCYDELDEYKGVVLDLPDGTEYALRRYIQDPEDTTTIYLPFQMQNIEEITQKIREILQIYDLTESDLEWERKDNPDL